jgi:hypothetical protein
VKRRILLAAVVPMALLSLLPAVEAGADLGPPAEAGGGQNGFNGFAGFDTHAQSQVATLTGFLNAFREDNSLVGSLSEINGPPASSRNITAFFQRGKGATFVYGVIGGPGGGRGTLPDPPPGEANAYYPTDDPPYEMTWSGPITGLGFPQVVDSKFHAKASEVPTGRAEGAVTLLVNPNYFTIGQATAVSHTEPVEGGVAAEAVSVVHELKVGPLLIQNIVSRAYAFVPTSGDPKGIATTVIDGAKVGDTPVQITDKGVVVADKTNPLGQEAINKQFADAGYPQVRLIPSVAKAGDDGASVSSTAGTLEFVKQDEKFGASNPQGFSGGGFSIGGAEAFVNTRRCSPDCGGGTSSDASGSGDTGTPPLSNSTSPSSDSAPTPSYAEGNGSGGYGADSSSTLPTDTSGSGLSNSGLSASGNLSSGGLDSSGSAGYGGGSSGSSTAVAPPDTTSGAGTGTGTGTESGGSGVSAGTQVAAGVPVQQAVAYTELGPKSAEWLRDLYLMAALALGIIFVGQRLARAFS